MSLVLINGLIRRIIKKEDFGPDLIRADVVTGFRTLRTKSGRRPGPGHRPAPGSDHTGKGAKKWVSHKDVITKNMVLSKSALLGNDWPIGFNQLVNNIADFDVTDLIEITKPFMGRAIQAGGVRARRTRPNISVSTLETSIKRSGLPMPTQEELDGILTELWEATRPKRRQNKRTSAGGHTIIPARRKPVVVIKNGDTVPSEIELQDEHMWCDAIQTQLPITDDGKAAYTAATTNGWPRFFIDGSTKTKRGDKGMTLNYMNKNKYDTARWPTYTEEEIAEKTAAAEAEKIAAAEAEKTAAEEKAAEEKAAEEKAAEEKAAEEKAAEEKAAEEAEKTAAADKTLQIEVDAIKSVQTEAAKKTASAFPPLVNVEAPDLGNDNTNPTPPKEKKKSSESSSSEPAQAPADGEETETESSEN